VSAHDPELPAAARAFADGDVDLLPSALASEAVDALVALLVERADGARLERLAASPDKSLAKPARRGLHLLRTRGAKIAAAPAREFRVHGPYASNEPPSIATSIDGHGERMVFLVRTGVDGSGFDVFQSRLSEERGLADFVGGSMGRKEWRAHERGILEERGIFAARVPGAHARLLVERAYERSVAEKRAVPKTFAEARIGLGAVERPERHPVYALAPPLPLDEARPRIGELLELDAFSAWVPSEALLGELDLEVGQIATSRLIVDPAQRLEQLGAAVERVADRALAGPFRALLAERLLETAYLLALRDRLADARLTTAAADLTADASITGASNPLVLALFDRLVDRTRLASPDPKP